MPEGDTIFRAARTLHEALAGRTVTRFESVFSRITRADEDLAIGGRTVDRVDARGKRSEHERDPLITSLGPDILSEDFDAAEATHRIQSMPDVAIGDALLDQHAIAGVGNIFKCEALFASGVDPFARVAELSSEQLRRVIEKARRLMRASIAGRRLDFSVYGRGGKQCRRCGSVIERRKEGYAARVTHLCPRCQRSGLAANARTS